MNITLNNKLYFNKMPLFNRITNIKVRKIYCMQQHGENFNENFMLFLLAVLCNIQFKLSFYE